MHVLHRAGLALALWISAAVWAHAAPYEETQKTHSWFSFNRPSEKTAEAQLDHADQLRDARRWRKASRAYHALVMTWPGAPEAPTAQLRYAEMLQKRGLPEDAFNAYQDLMDRFAGAFPYDEVLARQFEIAKDEMSRRRGKWLLFGGWKAPERAIPMFEKIVQNGPQWANAAEAQYLMGRAYELSEQQELAVGVYLVVQQRYPTSPFAEEASFARARCWYMLSEDSPNDEESLDQAWTAVSSYLANHARSDNAALAKEMKNTLFIRRARAAYEKAVYYDRVAKKPLAALQSYQNFVKLFPNSEWTSVAQLRMDELSKVVEIPK